MKAATSARDEKFVFNFARKREANKQMPVITLISRVSDGLLLAQGAIPKDETLGKYLNQALKILEKVDERSPDRMSIDSDQYYFL